MSSSVLVGFAIKSCADFISAGSMVSALKRDGAPDILTESIMMEKMQSLVFVGAAALNGSLPRDLFEKSLVAADCPPLDLPRILAVYDNALDAYRASVKSEGLDPDALPRAPLPEATADVVLATVKLKLPLVFAMRRTKEEIAADNLSPSDFSKNVN